MTATGAPSLPVGSRALLAHFAVSGAILGAFVSRTPSVRDALGVGNGAFARLLVLGALGAIAARALTARAVRAWGVRGAFVVGSLAHGAGLGAIAVAVAYGSPLGFGLGHAMASFAFAFVSVACRVEGAALERAAGRPVMPRLQGAFSAGTAAALAGGALLAHLRVDTATQFAVVAGAATAVRLGLVAHAFPAAATRAPVAAARLDGALLRIGLIVFCAAFLEGTASRWIALAAVDDYDQPESLAVLAYWLFVAAMVTARWWGGGLFARHGRRNVLWVAAGVAAVGVGTFALAPTFPVAAVGAALWGLGTAFGVPAGLSAAGEDSREAAGRVSAVGAFATFAGLAAPLVVGHLGELVPLHLAVLVGVGAAAGLGTLAPAAGDGRGKAAPHRPQGRADTLGA